MITGLSLLLRLRARTADWLATRRGMLTIILAHITFTMSYVAVVVQSRLALF